MQKINNILPKNKTIKLEDEFDEALKDEIFKSLAAKTKLKKEMLMKYTTTLKECSSELSHCKNCPGLMACQNKINGYVYLPKVVENVLCFGYKPCKYTLKQAKINKYLDNVFVYYMPKEIREASFKKIYKTDKKRYNTIIWLSDFMEKYLENKNQKGLYLSGNFGSGKTYLISAMFNELAKNNIKSSIIFWPEFLRDLKSSFNSNFKGEFDQKFKTIQKTPLLLIDDIGAESVTSWNRDEILCPLLQYRMDENLPTFFTSNLNLDELEQHLRITSKGDEIVKSGRIISRIKQLTEYQELISKNLRK